MENTVSQAFTTASGQIATIAGQAGDMLTSNMLYLLIIPAGLVAYRLVKKLIGKVG